MQQKLLAQAVRFVISGATTAGLTMTTALTSLAAQAQTSTEADGEERRRDPFDENVVLAPMKVTADALHDTNGARTGIGRLPDTVRDTPKTITVVPQELIEQQRATSLEQVLKNVPGITMSTGEGNGGQNGDQFSIRGMSSKGDIYVDGLRDFGAYRRDSFDTESVEVIKGPFGAIFGVGNVGGIINQTSKQALLETRASVNQSYGSGHTWRTTADGNIRLGETTALRINGMFQEGSVPGRDHVKDDRRGVAIDFGTGIGTGTEWHLNYAYLHRNGVPDFGVPMAQGADRIYRPLTEYDVPGMSSSTSYVRNTDRDITDTHTITSRFASELGHGITIDNDTRFSVYDRDFSATNPGSVSAANLNRLLAGDNSVPLSYGAGGGMIYRQHGWAVQNVSSLKADFALAGFRNKAMVGLDASYHHDHRDGGTWTGRVNNQTVVNPAWQMPPGASVSYGSSRDMDADATDVGLFANDRLWLTDQVSLLAGLRWDYFRSKFDAPKATDFKGGTADAKKLSPSISAIWEPTRNAMFYTSFARTWRPIGTDIAQAVGGIQSEVPLGGVDNEPERSDTVEIGTKLDFFDKRLGVTGALFWTKKTNSYTIDPATGDIAGGFSENGEGRRVRGVELGLTGRLTDNWSANLAYAYLDGKVTYASTQSSIGNIAPGVPRNNLTLWTTYDVPHQVLPVPGQLAIGGGLQYASGYWADSANTARMPEKLSVDAMISYRFNRYRISLNGYNLTDHLNYQSAFSSSRAVPGSRRTFMLNVGIDL